MPVTNTGNDEPALIIALAQQTPPPECVSPVPEASRSSIPIHHGPGALNTLHHRRNVFSAGQQKLEDGGAVVDARLQG